MKHQHTPGPWEWTDLYKASDGRDTWTLVSPDGYGILSCDGEDNSPQGIGDHANARLIVAAPELLEALEHVRDAMEASGGWEGDEDVFRLVVQAIAKATGPQEDPR